MAVENVNFGALGISSTPVGGGPENTNAYRDIFADLFTQTAMAREDWMRNEQSQNNQLLRDLYFQDIGNKFNHDEAQLARDYDERMARNKYTYAVEDLKRAGLNPVLALGSPASAPSGASAHSSGSRSSGAHTSGGYSTFASSLLAALPQVLAGIYTAGASNATAEAIAAGKNATSKAIAAGKNATSKAIAAENNATKFNIAALSRKGKK